MKHFLVKNKIQKAINYLKIQFISILKQIKFCIKNPKNAGYEGPMTEKSASKFVGGPKGHALLCSERICHCEKGDGA
jgi:hypothetical protein